MKNTIRSLPCYRGITNLALGAVCLALLGLGLRTGWASTQEASVVISAATDYRSRGFPTLVALVQHGLDTCDVVYFDGSQGPINLSESGPDSPLLTIQQKSVSLKSLDAQHPATLTFIDRGILVAGAMIDVSLKNLNLQFDRTLAAYGRSILVSDCNNLTIAGCELTTSGASHTIWCQGTLTGNINITGSTLNCGNGMPIGMLLSGASMLPIVVEGCTLQAGGPNGFAISIANANGQMTFQHNVITGCAVGVAVWSYLGGNIDCSNNEITVDHLAWWGNGIGVFVAGSDPNSTVVCDQNVVHSKTANGNGFAAGDPQRSSYNVTFRNSVVDGQGWTAATIENSHGCVVTNIDRSKLTLTQRPDFPLSHYHLFDGSTGNTIIDHGTPIAVVYEDGASAGQNQLDVGTMPPASAPQLALNLTAGALTLAFEGTLQAADNPGGPWTDLQAASPLTVAPNGAMKFYRAKR